MTKKEIEQAVLDLIRAQQWDASEVDVSLTEAQRRLDDVNDLDIEDAKRMLERRGLLYRDESGELVAL